jgi:Uma2 family endonuclease
MAETWVLNGGRVSCPGSRTVCVLPPKAEDLGPDFEQWVVDGKLIQAAPQLYEACEAAGLLLAYLSWYENALETLGLDEDKRTEYRRVQKLTEDAIVRGK